MDRRDRKRVVIVDGSKTMQAVLDQVFSLRMGCDVVGIASDVDSAASLVRSLRPDLVTIDLPMPYIDGRRLLEMVADLPDVRKIMISTQIGANLAIATRLLEAGADACIDKHEISSNPAEFCKKIMAVMAKTKRPGRTAADDRAPFRPAVVNISSGVGGGHYPIPADEQARLAALLNSGLTNDCQDTQFDLLTSHMATVTDFPTCLMTFIDRDRQWIKSAYGFERGSTPRAFAFCNYTLCADEALVVTNAATDLRFAQNPFVTGDPGVRTYVGCPITSSVGVRLGAICLLDNKSRRITPTMVNNLRSVSKIATQFIEIRGSSLSYAA